MSEHEQDLHKLGRRDFFKAASAGLATAGVLMTPREAALAQAAAEKARLDRLAGCTWPIRSLFKTRQQAGRGGGAAGGGGRGGAAGAGGGRGQGAGGRGAGENPTPTVTAGGVPIPTVPANRDNTSTAEMKKKYGEITMLDFPQWTKDNFPGVTRMDLFSGLFGDVTDDSMYMTAADGGGGGGGFDPMSKSGRKWLDRLASQLVATGTKVQHISNNAPFGLPDFGTPEAD